MPNPPPHGPKRPHAPEHVRLWLTQHPDQARPSSTHEPVLSLEGLWARLQRGDCSQVLVDRRFGLVDADAWEVALLVRERYPTLPLALWAPPPGAPIKPRSKRT